MDIEYIHTINPEGILIQPIVTPRFARAPRFRALAPPSIPRSLPENLKNEVPDRTGSSRRAPS
jgi:hypothetical protein